MCFDDASSTQSTGLPSRWKCPTAPLAHNDASRVVSQAAHTRFTFMSPTLFLNKTHDLGADLEEVGAAGQVTDVDLGALGGGDKLPCGGVDTQGGISGNALYAEDFVRGVGINNDRTGLCFVRSGGHGWGVGEGDFDNVFHVLFSQQIALVVNELDTVVNEDPFANGGNVFHAVGTKVAVLNDETVCHEWYTAQQTDKEDKPFVHCV